MQSAALAVVWYVADFIVRRLGLPVPGGVVGLIALLALLFSGGLPTRWIKSGADWLLSDMLLFFIPAAVAAVQYGGLFREDGWRLALVVVAGTLMVMVAVAFAAWAWSASRTASSVWRAVGAAFALAGLLGAAGALVLVHQTAAAPAVARAPAAARRRRRSSTRPRRRPPGGRR